MSQNPAPANVAPTEREPYYITTAIPYVNARPHIGFALEIILTDAVARYQRLRGKDVRFLTGTDENSLKNVQAAEALGVPTADLVEENAGYFLGLGEALDLSFDDFIRTSSEDRHTDGVRKLWEAAAAKGDLYKKRYSGLYCVGCELFYREEELDEGRCPEHGTIPDLVEEENYFFKLKNYAVELEELIASGTYRVEPEKRRNEVLSFIRMGLEDFSVSRSVERARGWGVTVPADDDQVMYVWFDALGNYITALDYAEDGPLYDRYWKSNPERVHVIGKGITRFHAIYWPAMLLSAGERLPSTLFVHGYVNVGGQKMSKSLGNVVDPVEIAQEYGADALRYFLLRHIRSTEDGDFTVKRFIESCNAGLADQLGNLLSRTIGMVGRYFDGIVPEPGAVEPVDQGLIDVAEALPAEVDAAMEIFETHEAANAVWKLLDAANKYVVNVEPWTLAKARKAEEQGPEEAAAEARLCTVLYNLTEVLRIVSIAASPFVPGACAELRTRLGLEAEMGVWPEIVAWGGYPAGTELVKGEILFVKHEVPEVEGADEA
jgi:methionyl-tRNA synthetase